MGFRCDRTEALVDMEGMDTMIAWIVVGICMTALVVALLYGIYMAIWGVYDEFY